MEIHQEVSARAQMVASFQPRLVTVKITDLESRKTFETRVRVTRERFKASLVTKSSPGLPAIPAIVHMAALAAAVRKIFGAQAICTSGQVWKPCKTGGLTSVTGRVRIDVEEVSR